MMVGGSTRSLRKKGALARTDAEVQTYKELISLMQTQITGLIHINQEMTKKMAFMGIQVKIGKGGELTFEPVR